MSFRIPNFWGEKSNSRFLAIARNDTMVWASKIFIAILIFCSLTISTISATNIHVLKDTTVVPGPEYEASSIYQFFLGEHWRDLWTTPITVPVLDLKNTAGGLTAIKRGGGFQTKSLHFKGANNKYYKFRSINKDPAKLLPSYLQKTFVAEIYQDQISASHPLSSLIVAPLLNAVGVLNAQPVVVVLPNSPDLGEYRSAFKNVLGTFSENPKDDTEEAILFEGADKVKRNYDIFEKCEKSNKNQVDAIEFLKARLMDVFLGDWDRHIGQWKWARFKINDKNIWRPIPRDRDQAFSRWDGIFPLIVADAIPQIENFEDDYPQVNDITWSGRYLDRRFLAPVTKTQWDSVTLFIQSRLTEEVIKDAVKRVPKEWFKNQSKELVEALIQRRDKLGEISQKYYEMVFKYIAIYASDKDEYALINRIDNNTTSVSIYNLEKKTGARSGKPFFKRTFDNDITNEIRLFMLGGDDKALISGTVDVSPLVRVIGGGGSDELIDSSKVNGYFLAVTPIPDAENKTILYDSGKKTNFYAGASTIINTYKEKKPKPFNEETDNVYEKYEPQIEDRGHDWKPGAWLSYNSDDGLIIGGGPSLYAFDYRYEPFVYRMSLQGAYATTPRSWNIRFNSEFYDLIRNTRLTFDLGKSELSFAKFYGFGNDTKKDDGLDNGDYYRVKQELLYIESRLEYPAAKNYKFWLGYTYKFSQMYLSENSLLSQTRPVGIEDWSTMGLSAGLEYDNRDSKIAPMSGLYVSFYNIHFPPWLDNEKSYSKTKLDIRAYLKSEFITTSSLAFRLYGAKLWGSYPFFDAAFLGGSENLRGYTRERFAGNAAAFGSMEWRAHLFPFKFVVPAKLGFLVFSDFGRVYYPGERSTNLHQSYGGGLWAYFIDPTYLGNLSIAKSSEDLAFYLSLGFPF